MGGSFSEPATCVDLGVSIAEFYSDIEAPKRCAGVLHVDDGLLLSTVWCEKCVFEGVAKIWPADVGAGPK